MNACAVVLAAGASSRMGRPKALLEIDGETFVARILRTAREAGVARAVVVLGHHADAIDAALAPDVARARNPAPERGQLSSLRVGLAAAGDCDVALDWPVDQPLVRPATVARLLAEAAARPGFAIVPRHGGRGGHPLLIPRALFAALDAIPDDEGARGLLRRHPGRIARIDVDDPGVAHDIDTPDDYAAVTR